MAPAPLAFVVMSAARSGTTVLIETLDAHPDALVHGEIFHENYAAHVAAPYRARHPVRPDLAPLDFARDVLGYAPGVACVGFKMWHNQAPAACDALLEDETVAKLVLERPNRLASWTSLRLAEGTGVWNLRPHNDRDMTRHRVRFDREGFLRHCANYDAIFARYRKRARGPVLELRYRSLPQPGIGRAMAFLGLAPLRLPEQRRKLHGRDVLARIEPGDHDEVRSVLAEIGHRGWISE